ncbi:sugar-binding transcriptional regulator [Pelagibius litoralis]|uniref:Sugar-binding transcriptional regulator n=2 Tax=Pelagibius litoralis TaxID=374515 RepID=A0A967C8I1_9PROT|nr:sugar-binding transcriptional regulator [Pelagibius litoralis]
MYFIEGRTQSEIASILGVGRVTVVRLLADARRRREVQITIKAPLVEITEVERALESRFGIDQAIVAPVTDTEVHPAPVIAAVAGTFISQAMRSGITVGVGWGRTLYSALPYITGRTLEDFRVVSLLGGISQARRFNPAEFAWQFNELFQGEGFLVPAPALVDSPETKHALLERCGIAQVFEMADSLDIALLSVGGISTLTTSYRVGHLSEAERRSLIEAGAVGDILYNFINEEGELVDHPVNERAISVSIDRLKRTPQRVLISGGPEKTAVLRGSIRLLEPTTLITDEATARSLLS